MQAGELGSEGWNGRDAGAALVLALITTAVVMGVAMMMLTLASIEREGSAGFRDGAETFYAADAALEIAMDEVAVWPSWSPLLFGGATLRWTGSASAPALPFGGTLDLPALTAGLHADTVRSGLGADTPVWQLIGHAPFGAIWPGAGPVAHLYVAVWAADDPEDADGQPRSDTNGRIQLHAEAWGRRQSRRAVEALVKRGTPGIIRQVSWREVR